MNSTETPLNAHQWLNNWSDRDFWRHPEFRGPKFHWCVPARLAYYHWRTL
jgi:hypothetical protein